MEIEEVKNILSSAWNVKREYEEDFERIQRLRAQLTKVTPSYSKAPGAGNNDDKMGEMVGNLVSMETEYRNHIAKYFNAVRNVQNLVDSLDRQSHRRVLKLRYLDYNKWEDVASIMNYDIRHVTRLHNEALQELSRIIKN